MKYRQINSLFKLKKKIYIKIKDMQKCEYQIIYDSNFMFETKL